MSFIKSRRAFFNSTIDIVALNSFLGKTKHLDFVADFLTRRSGLRFWVLFPFDSNWIYRPIPNFCRMGTLDPAWRTFAHAAFNLSDGSDSGNLLLEKNGETKFIELFVRSPFLAAYDV